MRRLFRYISHIAFTVLFGILGLALIASIFFSQITVATGTINGLIFYVNTLNAYQNVFFPDSSGLDITVFISWLNLNFRLVSMIGWTNMHIQAYNFYFHCISGC